MDGLDAPNIVREGFVSDERKLELLRGCEALVLPSIFESLSLVMLEAWAERRPVIVDGGCAVTAGHIHRSGGGETYADSAEFSASLARMLADAKRRGAQAASGRRYVEERYRWTEVEDRMLSLVERVRASATG